MSRALRRFGIGMGMWIAVHRLAVLAQTVFVSIETASTSALSVCALLYRYLAEARVFRMQAPLSNES